jgi:hypothetical protein
VGLLGGVDDGHTPAGEGVKRHSDPLLPPSYRPRASPVLPANALPHSRPARAHTHTRTSLSASELGTNT